jgi:hypothetical protein
MKKKLARMVPLVVAAGGMMFTLAAGAQNFDPDSNGLYDDTERKALLDVLQTQYPSAKAEGIFDANGDGKVSVEEMTDGRHPLSQVLATDFLMKPTKIPWAIDLFPEWLMTAYVQDDNTPGTIAQLPARGNYAVIGTQPDAALQPRKNSAVSGIEFAADSGQFIQMKGHRDARWDYRWMALTFRIDSSTGTGNDTVLLDINRPNKGDGPGKSSPKVWFDKSNGTLNVQYTSRDKQGVDRRIMFSKAVITDGKTWNVLVAGIRQGSMFAALNGVELATAGAQPPRYSVEMIFDTTSFIGDHRKTGTAWALDSLFLGQTELSEAMVRKLSGWGAHRLGITAGLPTGHPYREARPV